MLLVGGSCFCFKTKTELKLNILHSIVRLSIVCSVTWPNFNLGQIEPTWVQFNLSINTPVPSLLENIRKKAASWPWQTKEITKHIRDKVDEKYIAGLGHKKKISIFHYLTGPSLENGKNVYQEKAIQQNWRTVHRQLFVMHSTDLALMEEWWEENCCWRKAIRISFWSLLKAMWRHSKHVEEGAHIVRRDHNWTCPAVLLQNAMLHCTSPWAHQAHSETAGTGKLVRIEGRVEPTTGQCLKNTCFSLEELWV